MVMKHLISLLYCIGPKPSLAIAKQVYLSWPNKFRGAHHLKTLLLLPHRTLLAIPVVLNGVNQMVTKSSMAFPLALNRTQIPQPRILGAHGLSQGNNDVKLIYH